MAESRESSRLGGRELVEFPAEGDDGSQGNRQRDHGSSGEYQRPHRSAPSAHPQRRNSATMLAIECRRGSTVGETLPGPGRPTGPRMMMHGRRRLVAAAMAGFDQSPHQIDVLACPHRLVEPADRSQCIDAHQQRRGRHVADARAGGDATRLGTEVERRSRNSYCSNVVEPSTDDDPRGDERDQRVAEVRQQRVEPIVADVDVGIDERNERGGDFGETGIASRAPDRCSPPAGSIAVRSWRSRAGRWHRRRRSCCRL